MKAAPLRGGVSPVGPGRGACTTDIGQQPSSGETAAAEVVKGAAEDEETKEAARAVEGAQGAAEAEEAKYAAVAAAEVVKGATEAEETKEAAVAEETKEAAAATAAVGMAGTKPALAYMLLVEALSGKEGRAA